MEFKEFANVEGRDYDLYSNDGNIKTEENTNPYVEELLELIGLLEDIDEEELMSQYGITLNEYLHPTEETIKKVKEAIGIKTL